MNKGDAISWKRKYKGGFQPTITLRAVFLEYVGKKAAKIIYHFKPRIVSLDKIKPTTNNKE